VVATALVVGVVAMIVGKRVLAKRSAATNLEWDAISVPASN
jgi:hypothetical protein